MNRVFCFLFFVTTSFIMVPTATASERIKGTFVLTKDCDAYRSISKQTGKTGLKSGKKYQVKQKNKPSPSHYQIAISKSKLFMVGKRNVEVLNAVNTVQSICRCTDCGHNPKITLIAA